MSYPRVKTYVPPQNASPEIIRAVWDKKQEQMLGDLKREFNKMYASSGIYGWLKGKCNIDMLNIQFGNALNDLWNMGAQNLNYSNPQLAQQYFERRLNVHNNTRAECAAVLKKLMVEYNMYKLAQLHLLIQAANRPYGRLGMD